MLEVWDNPFIPIEERLEIAAGSVKFWKESWQHQLKQKEELQAKLAQAEEHISMAFHPDLGWAIKPEEYTELLHKYQLVTRTYTKRIAGVGIG